MNIAKKTSPISTNSHCTNSQQIVQNYYQQGFLRKELNRVQKLYNSYISKNISFVDFYYKLIKGPHQIRLSKIVVQQAAQNLANNINISNLQGQFQSFEDLYNKVRNLILIKGISNLTVYDVAMRIGSLVNLEPQNDVYVARGAMIGARKLLGNNIVRKNLINGVKLPITLFSNLFPGVCSRDLEVIIYIYKKYFLLNGFCPNTLAEISKANQTKCSPANICGKP